MRKKLLKTTLFGFSKTEVCEYMARVSEEFNQRIDLLTVEHDKEKREIELRIAALSEELERTKQTNVAIVQALTDARQQAEDLKAKADSPTPPVVPTHPIDPAVDRNDLAMEYQSEEGIRL